MEKIAVSKIQIATDSLARIIAQRVELFFLGGGVVLTVPAHGHINPTLAVVQELAKRGERITYFSTEPFRSLVESTGATFRAYNTPMEMNIVALAGIFGPKLNAGESPPQPKRAWLTLDRSRAYKFVSSLLRVQTAALPEIVDALRSDRPDYVIYNNVFLAGRLAAQRLGLPAIASIATLFRRPEGFPLQPPKEGEEGFQEYASLRDELKRSDGLDVSDAFSLMASPAALNIVYTSREFRPRSEEYDEDRYKFVGPSIMRRRSPHRFPFERLDAARPLVYVSLGTIFNNRPEFYRLCIDAFRDGAYQVVMALPHHIDPNALGTDIPGNFILEPFVPQLDLFPRVAVFVSHGGMSSMMEALYFGVPLVFFPQMFEQAMNAQRAAELRAGVVLPSDNEEALTADKLRAEVERVAGDPSFRESARKISSSLRAAGGYRRAADEILAFVQKRSSTG